MTYQVRYWFDIKTTDQTGDHVIEIVESANAAAVASSVRESLSQPSFTILPSFGQAHNGGLIVVHSRAVRFVEIVPVTATTGAASF